MVASSSTFRATEHPLASPCREGIFKYLTHCLTVESARSLIHFAKTEVIKFSVLATTSTDVVFGKRRFTKVKWSCQVSEIQLAEITNALSLLSLVP